MSCDLFCCFFVDRVFCVCLMCWCVFVLYCVAWSVFMCAGVCVCVCDVVCLCVLLFVD